MTASSPASAKASIVGQRFVNLAKYGFTAATVVCCSMISDSQTRYGSGAGIPGGARHGRSRAWESYQFRSVVEMLACTRALWHIAGDR